MYFWTEMKQRNKLNSKGEEIMGLNCKKQVGKMKSIMVKLENVLLKERQLQKEKKENNKDKR